jgi:hypothetical protein
LSFLTNIQNFQGNLKKSSQNIFLKTQSQDQVALQDQLQNRHFGTWRSIGRANFKEPPPVEFGW